MMQQHGKGTHEGEKKLHKNEEKKIIMIDYVKNVHQIEQKWYQTALCFVVV